MRDREVNTFEEESVLKDARSPYASYMLPTGYLDKDELDADGRPTLIQDIELKEITGQEEDMLASRNSDANQKMNNLMSSCLTKVGKYTDPKKIREIVLDLVSNDRFFIVYKLREISLGKEYRFKAPCPHCKDDKLRVVDLSSVQFPSLPNPLKRIHEGILPKSQMKYKWAVQNGHIESRLARVLKAASDNLFSAMIAQRLLELDEQPSSIQDVKKLVTMDRNHLRREFERVEGTFDDEIIVDCPECGNSFNVEVNIGDKEFFFPTA